MKIQNEEAEKKKIEDEDRRSGADVEITKH